MHSRAYLLIERELEYFEKEAPWGLEARKASGDSIFQWIVKLHGLRKTDWEDGVFQLTVQFNEEFDARPPVVHFLTIPFHPNVEPTTGYVALDLLLNGWSPNIRMVDVLIATQALLSAPDPCCIVNHEAGDLLVQQTASYRRLTIECVRASQRLEEDFGGVERERTMATVDETRRVIIEYSPEQEIRRKRKERAGTTTAKKKQGHAPAGVNFEDYLATWNGIATSKATEKQVNSYLQLIQSNPKLISIHHCLPFEEIESQLVQQMEQHRSLTYGNIARKKRPESEGNNKAEDLERIEMMRKMYISQRTHSNLSRREGTLLNIEQTACPINSARGDDKELELDGDNDVDDLVAWTQDLDVSKVD